MRILHTSDWHLGKSLEGFSRLEEQEQFLQELNEIVTNKAVDLVLIAGDIYDSPNPSAQAETLFYDTVKILANHGERAVLVIAGNHDNPERLTAASSLAKEQGVILLGKPKSQVVPGQYGNFTIVESGEAYLKLQMRDELLVLLTMPYPSEKRLNEILPDQDEACAAQKAYSEKVGEIFQTLSRHFQDDAINLAVSHLYVKGGLESDSERQIQLGGSPAVDPAMLPAAQYIALGHLHRPQKVGGTDAPCYYSGSPLQYSKSEIGYSKAVYIIDVQPGAEAHIEEVYLRNYKPIEVWECDDIDAALERCRQEQDTNSWVYIDIKTDRVLTQAEIKEMKSLRKDIVQIRPVFIASEADETEAVDFRKLNIDELFRAFYRKQRQGAEAPPEIINLFYRLMEEGEEADEAAAAAD